MTTIEVNTGRRYVVEIGNGLLSQLGQRIKRILPKAQRIAVVTDTNVEKLYGGQLVHTLCGEGFSVVLFSFPAGEASKTGETYLSLLEFLADSGITRSDALVALGGGVVGDLCGFAAASYLRGVPFVQVPTTLLAAVDSSVGGKTAIDLRAGKNLAGAFYQPSLVLCDLDTFSTLPQEVFSDGCAEVIKYGMLGSQELLDRLRMGALTCDLEGIVAQCVAMKRDIVERDEFETGDRQLLNLGHTLGHAIEKCSAYTVSHGRAVAMGMMLITRSAVKMGLCPPQVLDGLSALLTQFSLPTASNESPGALLSAALGDKKREGGQITLIIPTGLGQSIRYPVAVEELPSWIEMGLFE